MILCLNLNAAIDKTVVVSSFEVNQIHRPESVIALAGGKGSNVARALARLGETPVVSGWVGGFAGRFIESELHREGIQTDFVYTDSESRTCTSILDLDNQTLTEIYEPGQPVPSGKVDRLRDRFRATIRNYRAVTFSGSLPPGVPSDFYAELIGIARNESVLTFLDSSGDALRRGAEAGPFFVKPNESEARFLMGMSASDTLDPARAAAEIAKRYKTNVVLSLGADGAIAATADELFLVECPVVQSKSAVGSGDCTLAGLTHGYLKGNSFEEAIICGVAAGIANTLTIGAGQFKIEDFERLRGQIRVFSRRPSIE